MSSPLRQALRWIGVVLLAAPLPIGGVLVGTFLLEPPAHLAQPSREKLRFEPLPLQVGDRRVLSLPQGNAEYSGVVAFVGTYVTRPRAEFEICAADRCATTTQQLEDNSLVHLPLPTPIRGGEVTVALRSVDGGRLAYWAHEGEPFLRPSAAPGWLRPMETAAGSFQLQAGPFWWALLAMGAVGFASIFGVSVWRAVAER